MKNLFKILQVVGILIVLMIFNANKSVPELNPADYTTIMMIYKTGWIKGATYATKEMNSKGFIITQHKDLQFKIDSIKMSRLILGTSL